jgi:acetyltransferase-like isoleucine patch superfamily enzyme
MKLKIADRWKWRLYASLHGRSEASRRLGVTVGRDCDLLSMNVSSEYHLITIGDRVTVSSDVLFITHDGSGRLVKDALGRRHYRLAPIVVGDDVFIGARAVIMPGVRLGDRVVVAAGSVITKSIASDSVVGGNPARYLMRFEDFAAKVDDWPTDRRPVTAMKPYLAEST